MSFLSRHVTASHEILFGNTETKMSSGKPARRGQKRPTDETKNQENMSQNDEDDTSDDDEDEMSEDVDTSDDDEDDVFRYQKSQSNWSRYGDLNFDGIKNVDDLELTVNDIPLYFAEEKVKPDGNCFYHAMVNYIVSTGDVKYTFMQNYLHHYNANIKNKSLQKAYGDEKEEYRKMYMMHWLRKEILEYHKHNPLSEASETREERTKHLQMGVNKTGLDLKLNKRHGKVGQAEWTESYENDLMARYLGIEICTLSSDQWTYSTHGADITDLEGKVCFLKHSGNHFSNLMFRKPPEDIFWKKEYRTTETELLQKNKDIKHFMADIGQPVNLMEEKEFEKFVSDRNKQCWNFYRYVRDTADKMDGAGNVEGGLAEKKKIILFHILTDREGRGVSASPDHPGERCPLDVEKNFYDKLLSKNEKIDRINRFNNYIIWAQNFLQNNNENAYFYTDRFFSRPGIPKLLSIEDITKYNGELKKIFIKEIERIDLEGMGKMTKRKFRSIGNGSDLIFKTHARFIKDRGDTYQTDQLWKISEKETNKATDEVNKATDEVNKKLSDEERNAEIVRLRSVDNVLDDIDDKIDQDIYFKQMAVFLLRHYQLLQKPKNTLPGVFLSSYPNFKWRFENKDKMSPCGWRWEALINKGVYRTDEQMESIRKTHSLINELNELVGEDGINLALGSTLGELDKLEKIIKMAKRKYRDMQIAGKQMIKKKS